MHNVNVCYFLLSKKKLNENNLSNYFHDCRNGYGLGFIYLPLIYAPQPCAIRLSTSFVTAKYRPNQRCSEHQAECVVSISAGYGSAFSKLSGTPRLPCHYNRSTSPESTWLASINPCKLQQANEVQPWCVIDKRQGNKIFNGRQMTYILLSKFLQLGSV